MTPCATVKCGLFVAVLTEYTPLGVKKRISEVSNLTKGKVGIKCSICNLTQ